MNSKQLTIRVGNNTLSFTMTDPTNAEQPVLHEPYVVKSGISMVANLREAFKTYARAIDLPTARVLINTPVLMVPIEQFQEADATTLYLHSFPRNEKDVVRYNVLPTLNAVCIFCINKDLLSVFNDHFDDVQIIHVMVPVWNHLHQRSFTGHRSKIYVISTISSSTSARSSRTGLSSATRLRPAVPTTPSISCSMSGNS